jgi:hypothetical protein
VDNIEAEGNKRRRYKLRKELEELMLKRQADELQEMLKHSKDKPKASPFSNIVNDKFVEVFSMHSS